MQQDMAYIVNIQDGRGYRKKGVRIPASQPKALKKAWAYALEVKTPRNTVEIYEETPNTNPHSMLRVKYTLVANVK